MNVLLVFVIALLVLEQQVEADFFYNRITPKEDELETLGLKCVPGRTVIRIEERKQMAAEESHSDEDYMETRRTHMNYQAGDENCQICVCSVEGKDEYCSRRPARNVNECIRMSRIKKEFESHVPFSHERSLAHRIRRDYLWHDDEIPYDAKASCRRGRSYYSNSVTANDTDIDVASDVDSLLDYTNKDICFYCVCSTDGKTAGCIARDPWFCEYFRIIRYPNAPRDRYRALFGQDRPAYFRQLSYRLRRRMDEGVFDLMESVGSGLDNKKCIPYVSEYSDCSEANACSGCTKCTCTEENKWSCQEVFECPTEDQADVVDDFVLENAINNLYTSAAKNKANRTPGFLVPEPSRSDEDLLLVPEKKFNIEDDLLSLLSRDKRSVNLDNENATIKFYEAVDEINEDTLKASNLSGTIEARKVDPGHIPKITRRSGVLQHTNTTDLNSLHIEYNEPHELDHHISENKVDSIRPVDDKINGLSHEEVHKILGNYSQNVKNKDLSKLVVNELARGTETIGDKHVTPLSNITFTPENDTLTAMTFIAGNLLNKLWDLEKDASENSFETEVLKHDRINDLLELFKEPLSLRQESFLKNALEKLSQAINQNRNVKNVTLCTNFEEEGMKTEVSRNCTGNRKSTGETEVNESTHNNEYPQTSQKETNATADAIIKINGVLNLINKYENLQKKISEFKHLRTGRPGKTNIDSKEDFSADQTVSLNLLGNLLDKITKLLSPNRNKKGITKKIRNFNMLRQDNIAKQNIERLFRVNLGNATMSAKDKMIIDYLQNIDRHPNCFLSNLQKSDLTPIGSIESSILYNLSEFFKIKSLADLLNILQIDKPENAAIRTFTNKYFTATTKPITTPPNFRSINKIVTAKEKLKNDLKIILQDLVELQAEHGVKTKTNINIADALPCIYNILNANKDVLKSTTKTEPVVNPVNKIKSFIDSLKLDMKFMTPSRRSNVNAMPKPKSAVVWERAIKNLNNKRKLPTRRSFEQPTKSFKEIKEMIEKVEQAGNSYKNFAFLTGVPPAERLVLLKTLQADVKQYTDVLGSIQKSFDTLTKLPVEKQNEFNEFIDNAAMSINLNKKVADNLDNLNAKRLQVAANKAKEFMVDDKPMKMTKLGSNDNDKLKLRRDEIINQLILNRLKVYIKMKENSDIDLNRDISYNIAKRALFYLENGNNVLAKELFKVFVANKQRESSVSKINSDIGNINKQVEETGPKLLAFKEPLIQVENPKRIKMLNQDYFKKQLWDLND